MSERIPAPGDLDKTNWNNDGATYPPATPNAAKRLTGYKPLNVPVPGAGEIITAGEQNWLHGLAMQLWTWFKTFVPREWGDVSEGIAVTSVFQLFRVFPSLFGSALPGMLDELFNVPGTGTGAGNLLQLVTDGERLYYITGGYTVAADPTDGDEIWEHDPGALNTCIDADGSAVFVGHDATWPGIRKLNRDTGNPGANVPGTGHSYKELRSNGFFVAAIAPSVDRSVVDLWTAAVPTYEATATPSTGAGLLALAIDAKAIYVAGTRNTEDVWSYSPGIGALNAGWAVTLDVNDPSPVLAMCTDGTYIYVCTRDFVTDAGPTRNLFCLARDDGSLVWSMLIGTAVDLVKCAVDDQYLYVVDDANVLHQIWLAGSDSIVIGTKSSIGSVACDGIGVAGYDSATPTNLYRRLISQPTKTFMRVSGTDANRRPIYTLAVPVGKG